MTEFIATHLQAIFMGAALLGIGAAALFGFTRQEDIEGEKILLYDKNRAKRPLAVAVVLLLLASTAAFVPKGYVGVVYDWNGGIEQEERPEGLNFVFPFKEHVTNVDTRVKAWTFNDEKVYVHTEDFHEIRVPFTINYRINPDEAAHVLQSVSGDPAETILSHAALNSVRAEVGRVVLDKLAQNVSDVAQAVEDTITPQAEANGLFVQYVAIEDTVVDASYTQAVRDERISERKIRTAENDAEAAEFSAEQVRIEARGQADAVRFVAEAREDEINRLGMTGTEYVWLTRDNLIMPTTLVGPATDILLGLPSDNE